MFPVLSPEQRQAIEKHGVPLPVLDEATNRTYALLNIEFLPDPDQGGFTAHIPSIAAYGEGETQEEAALALSEALKGYIEAFG